MKNYFSKWLTKRLEEEKENPNSFSKKIEVHKQTVYSWVNGDCFPTKLEFLSKIASFFNIEFKEVVSVITLGKIDKARKKLEETIMEYEEIEKELKLKGEK